MKRLYRKRRPAVKHAIRLFAFGCAVVIIAAPKNVAALNEPAGKPASLKAELLEDWSYQKESILKLINYMPAEKYEFTPPMPPQRFDDHGGALEGFGKRVLYIAQVNIRFLGLLGGTTPPPPEPK